MTNYLLKDGQVIDGTGKQAAEADILIRDGRIEKIGNLEETGDFQIINVKGLVVCPGFVDINNHSDTSWTLFKYPDQESLITQGVTTAIGGNCGSSLAPLLSGGAINSIQKYMDIAQAQVHWASFGEYLNFLEQLQLGLNFGSLAGHTTLRRALLGDEMRTLRKEELKQMTAVLDAAMREGALGLSAGLVYSHARSSTMEELVALAKVVEHNQGVFSIHLRDEGERWPQAVDEALEIAKKSGVNLEISHLKVCGRKNWPIQERVLEKINQAAENGLKVNYDVYPYTQAGPVLYTLLPEWLTEGGKEALISRLRDPKMKERARREMKEKDFDYGEIWIAFSKISPSLWRRRISDIARNQEREPEEVILDLVVAADDRITAIVELMSPKNVEKIVTGQLGMVSSNGIGYSEEYKKEGQWPHPRCFGAIPRFFKSYVREKQSLTWEEAVEKVTSRPARKVGLEGEIGILREGARADITIFDPRSIRDQATVEDPFHYSEGIEYVFVGGEPVIEEGRLTGRRPGKIWHKASK